MSSGAINKAFSNDNDHDNTRKINGTVAVVQDGTTVLSLSQDGSTLKSVSYASSIENNGNTITDLHGSSLEGVTNGKCTSSKILLCHNSFRCNNKIMMQVSG